MEWFNSLGTTLSQYAPLIVVCIFVLIVVLMLMLNARHMSFKAWAMTVGAVVVFVPCGIALYQVYKYLIWLGWVLLIEIGLLPTIGIMLLIVWGLKFFFQGENIEVGPAGSYYRWMGRIKALAPMTPIAPKPSSRVEVEAIPVPKVADLLASNSLVMETTDGPKALLGYRLDGQPHYDSLPPVFGIGGEGNAGKTVTLLLIIFIALLMDIEVIICDPHKTKTRSLWNKIKPLDGVVRFAFSDAEILQATHDFSSELHDRKEGIVTHFKPKLLIYDEATSILKRSEMGKEIATAVEEASQEGQGYDMHLGLILHDFSNAGLGNQVNIRNCLVGFFCHRISGDQSKFVFGNDRKLKKEIEGLPNGHLIFRNEMHETIHLAIPFGGTGDAITLRNKLKMLPAPQATYPDYSLPEHSLARREIERGEEIHGERFLMVNDGVKPREEGETSTEDGEYSPAFTMHSPGNSPAKSEYSPAEVAAVCKAVMALKQEEVKVTRTAIRDKLGWNNKKWDTIRAICAEYEIA